MKSGRGWMVLSLAMGLATVSGIAVAEDPEPTGDLKMLQGTWTADLMGSPSTWTFKGNELTIKGGVRSYVMKLKLDEKAEPNKTLDLEIVEGPEDAFGKTSLAIYKFEGENKWTLCFRGEGPRPEKFEQVGFEQWLLTLERKTD